jgi:hypothetical protein
MTKQPAKRGGRSAAPAGSAPQVSMSSEELAALVAGAVASALQAQQSTAINGAPVPAPAEEIDNEDDYAAEKERKRLRLEAEEEAARQVLATMIEPRFLEIFRWISQGKTAGQVIKELLRKGLIEHRAAYREAIGEGGASSRNIEKLAERLQPKA